MLDWLDLPEDDRGKGQAEELAEDVRGPSPAEEHVAEAERLYFDGELAAAAAEFAKARRHDALLFAAWAAESEAYLRAGDLARADACATEALDTFGRVPVFYAAKAIVLAHEGYLALAYEHSDISVRGHEASAFTWLSRAEVVLAASLAKGMESVDVCLAKAYERDPTGWQARFRAALILLDWGFADTARQRLLQTATVAPDTPFLWKLVGDCHRHLGQDALAREHYRLALAKRPGYRPARKALRSMTFWGRLRGRLGRLFRADQSRRPRT